MAGKRWFHRLMGNVKREIGEATGDRKVEAKGEAEAVTASAADENAVDAAMSHVRRRHGDVARKPGSSRRAGEQSD